MLLYTALPLIMGILIIVHELGHLLAARSLGIRVSDFSIGFGPQLISKNWGGTRFSLALIPFRGYVALHRSGSKPAFENAPVRRLLFHLAGPLANILGCAALLMLLALFNGDRSPAAVLLEPVQQTIHMVGASIHTLLNIFWNPQGFTTLIDVAHPGDGDLAGKIAFLLKIAIFYSVNLAVFNMIPLGGLDGAHVLTGLVQSGTNATNRLLAGLQGVRSSLARQSENLSRDFGIRTPQLQHIPLGRSK